MFTGIGEWKPDETQHDVGTISDLSNVAPDDLGFNSVANFSAVSDGIIEDGQVAVITGSKSFISPEGTITTFAGTDNGLYILEKATWRNVSIEGGYHGQGDRWQFGMYGNYILATNFQDKIQLFDISTSTAFEVMSETAPRAKCMAIVNEFLFLGNTVDEYDDARPGRIWWSSIGDPRGAWEPNQTTMCDYQDLSQGVFVVNIIGGETAKVFMRRAIARCTFVGSPTVFQIDIIDTARGCVGINALVNVGEAVYFLSDDGFYALSYSGSVPVGLGKVDRYVTKKFMGESLALSQAAVDRRTKVIWWSIPSEVNFETGKISLDKSLLLHYPSTRWGLVDNVFMSLHSLDTRGYTLDELDEINKNIDKLPFPLDSVMYKGGIPVLGCFDLFGRLCYGYGEAMDGFITTGNLPLGAHEIRTFVRRLRICVDGGKGHLVAISNTQSLSDTDNYSPDREVTRIGDYVFRRPGRYHKIRFKLRGDWTQFTGYDLTLDKEGTQ